jgi:hypothetical protein
MGVDLAGDLVRNGRAPVEFLLHRQDRVLDQLEHRAQFELRIAQEAEQQFRRAVARAAPEAHHGRIHAVAAQDDGLDGVGEGELQIVVGVHADFLAGAFERLHVLAHQVVDLLAVQVAVAVHHHHDFGGGLASRSPGPGRSRPLSPWRWP